MRSRYLYTILVIFSLGFWFHSASAQIRQMQQDSTVSGNLTPAGKVDTFRVVTTSDGQLDFALTSTNGIYTWVTLYDKDTATVLKSNYTNTTFTLSTDGLAAGTYFVRVYTYYSNETSIYNLSYHLTPPPVPNDIEPNNNKAGALSLPQNSTTTGHVGYYYNKQRDSSDWYKITTNADGLLQFKLTSNNGSYVWVYLYDNNGTTQLNANYTNTSFLLNTDGLAAGTYYVRINCYYSDQFAPYTLTDSLFTPAQANDTEPNNNRGAALSLAQNSTVTGHVGYYYNSIRDSSDWYKVTTNADGMLQFKLTSNNGNYVWVYLFDNDGTTQLNATYSNTSFILNTDGLAAGTYYIRVNCYYSDQFAPYTLTDSLFNYNPNDPEPNNNPYQSTIIPANATATGHSNFYYNNAKDANDWWKINYGDSTGNLKITFNLLPAKIDNNTRYTWLQVYKDTLSAPIFNNYTNALSTDINFTSLTKGFYYFKVFPYYSDQFSPYSITPYFIEAYVTATISLLNATQGTGCSDNTLSYKLGGSTSPYTPYTVKLYRNNTFYDSVIINKDTVTFNYLPDGNYYATVLGFGAPSGTIATSSSSQFLPVTPTPIPTDIPVITKSGRLLSSSPHASRETYQWFRNDLLIPGATDAVYLAADSGSYKARFANSCGVGSFSNTIYFSNAFQNQTITFPVLADTVYHTNIFIKLNATASSGLPVSYRLVSGPAALSNDSVYLTGTGTIVIEANQQGNDNYGIAPPAQRSFNVLKAGQNISFTTISSKIFGDAPFGLSATSTSGLPVSFSIVSGPAIFNGATVTITGVGNVAIKASQGGNNNFNPAPDTVITFCVGIRQIASIKGDTIVCPNTFKYYLGNKISGAIYEWSISGGGILTVNGDTATVQWQTPGSYIVSVKAYSSCDPVRSDASTITVRVTTVIAPDVVTNMLPTNGTSSLQLPLTLSWAPGQNTSSFDLYVWDADSLQPSKPYAANLFSINYTLSGTSFKYNHTYKWMVRSKNGCAQSNGPVQTFSMVAQPDLIVSNIQMPSSAFSGQSISISWKVSNNGPGRTILNQRWTDAVFLSFDTLPNFNVPPNTNPGAWSQLSFPIKPLLAGALPNVTALDSGQSYTNTISFKLPGNYSWPIYAYVITNYSPGPTAPMETTLLNDTAHASFAIAITVSPAPDLRVDSVITPASSFSGSTINVSYKVKNYGVTMLPGGFWTDKIYISKEPFFNENTATLLQYPKSNGTYYLNLQNAILSNYLQLQQDSFYTRSAQVVIPNFIHGTYFIYVLTDAGNSIYEGTLENNNTNRSQMDIFLTPTPDLTVSSLTAPSSNVSTTQTMAINWNIKNLGYYDNIEKNKGHYLGIVQHCSVCYTPPCPVVYCDRCIVICPKPQPGYVLRDSIGFGSSTWTDKVYLSTDPSGLDISQATFLGSYEHAGGGTYGDDMIPPDFPRSLPEGANFKLYEVNTQAAINPGSEFPGTLNVPAPDYLPQGKYYLYVYSNADKGVYEYPDQPNIKRSDISIQISRPDLTVTSLTVPSSAAAGQTITISYNILNTGPGSVYSHSRRDYIYLSTSPVFDGSAQLIASPLYNESVPLNVEINHKFSYKLPVNISGTRYIYVITNKDSLFRENNMNNNTSAAASISISIAQSPDLLVSAIDMPATVFSIFGFPFKYTEPNQGAGPTSGTWIDSIFVSCSPTWNPSSAYGIAVRQHSDVVAVGGSYSDSFSLQVPFTFNISNCFGKTSSTAYFYIKTNADNGLYEGAGGGINNISGTGAKTIINPLVDLIVTSGTANDSAIAGRNYSITWTIKNTGYNPGNSSYLDWYDALYFSKDSVFNSNAVSAGRHFQNKPLNTNESLTTTSNEFIVPNIVAGDYYVFIRTNDANSIPSELQISNNVYLITNGSGGPIHVHVVAPLLPDLTDTLLNVPPTIAIGQPVTIKFSVINKGPGPTYPSAWSEAFWLSGDYIPGNAGDIYLGSVNHSGALQPGQSFTDSLLADIPIKIPTANYILIMTTNFSRTIFETNYDNNIAFKYVNIYSPLPTDLVVQNINHPDTALLGYPSTIGWNLFNNSANTANGSETDGIYLSKKTILDSTAILVGTKANFLNLLPLLSDTLSSSPLIQGVTEGSYNVIIKTDILNNIVENNKENNAGISASQIYVKVKELPLEVRTPGNIQNLNVNYKLVIPDVLNGATILLTLTTNDSLLVNNQMYVGFGYIPNPSHFDYQFGIPNAGNQQIIMPSVTNGVYYITIKTSTPNPPLQNITLLAHNLPFAILNVNAKEGGNTGNVTVKITGSLFSSDMQAKLIGSGSTVNASAIYFVDRTSIYATFNLQGIPLGLYDVKLIKADSSTAVLSNGFSVAKANNGGLFTGDGINHGQKGSGNEPGCDPGATSGLNAQMQTEVVIPSKAFAGWPFVIQINYSNPTNVDIPKQTRVLYSKNGIPVALTKDGLAVGKTSLYIEFSEQGGPPNIIRAGGTGSITIYSKAPPDYPGHSNANYELK